MRMLIRRNFPVWCAAAVVAFALPTFGLAHLSAQSKPKDATGQCKDGTYTTSATKSGACSSHGGVATWYADAKDGAKTTAQATKDGATTAAKATADGTTTAAKATADGTTTGAKATAGAAKTTGEVTKDASKTTANATASGAKTAADATAGGAKTAANATKKGIGAITGSKPAKPKDAPAAATGKCKDGTYTEAAEQKGACSQHGGVDAWYK